MIEYSDAQYVISEIRNIHYYEKKIDEIQKQIDELEERIETTTEPRSPNSGIDIVQNGIVMRYKVPTNHSGSAESTINGLISKQMKLEADQRIWLYLKDKASGYMQLLMATKQTGFVQDFFNGRLSYKQLEQKYYCSNAYLRMIRLVKLSVKSV